MNTPRRPGALLRHPLAIVGLLVTTTAAVVFVALTVAAMMGLFSSPYVGLVIFVAVPGLFVLGLILIPFGMWRQRRWLERHPDAPSDWPVVDFRVAKVRRSMLMFFGLAAVNVAILLVAGYGSLHWMETPGFCGQTCHTPMHVQFTAWQQGPHAKIGCPSCHVGNGPRGFVYAKLNGVHQLIAVVTNSYARPIPAGAVVPFGGHDATCGRCHQPLRIPGDVVRVIRSYGDDEKNTESVTVLLMHVGRGSSTGKSIHWHADPSNTIEFAYTDQARQTIPYVRVTRADGQVKEYFAADAAKDVVRADQLRQMDCVDCHNMVGHKIWPTPEQAVDRELAASATARQLPYVHREGVRLLKATYAGETEALQSIDRELRGFYASQSGVDQAAVASAVATIQGAYQHNVFPVMKVSWGAYPDNTGHNTSTGCFRCHDGSHTAKDGSTISADCELCHKQVDTPVVSTLPASRP